MIEFNKLEQRIESAIKECQMIMEIIDSSIGSSQTSSFEQLKEIERTIVSLQKKGLKIPNELRRLKLNLLSDCDNIEQISALKKYFIENLFDILSQDIKESPKKSELAQKIQNNAAVKEPYYERKLGSKGYKLLEDYLIPVIKLMYRGCGYKEAFHKVKDQLDVRYNTVSSQCTRGLGINTEKFVSLVNSRRIVTHLNSKFPEKYNLIKRELLDG